MTIPELRPTGAANVDAAMAEMLANFARWIEAVGGPDVAERQVANQEAAAQARLAACYRDGKTDELFDVPSLGAEHEAKVWRHERDRFRRDLTLLARFRVVNPQVAEAAQ